MKIELSCPSCSSGVLVDENAARDGFPCPGCGQPIIAAFPEPAAPVGLAATDEQVICPRCNLHFSPTAGTQARARDAAARQTVLVVEDMAYFREIAAEALSGEYAVKGVSTKAEALAALRDGPVDLIVLDLTLAGGKGGLELLHELPAKPCPILIFTAQDEADMYGDSWGELRALGADDIVLKGMNVGDELVRKVGTLLGKNWTKDE